MCQIEKYVGQEKLMYPCGNARQNQFNDSCKVCRDGQYLSHCLISFISPPFTVTRHKHKTNSVPCSCKNWIPFLSTSVYQLNSRAAVNEKLQIFWRHVDDHFPWQQWNDKTNFIFIRYFVLDATNIRVINVCLSYLWMMLNTVTGH